MEHPFLLPTLPQKDGLIGIFSLIQLKGCLTNAILPEYNRTVTDLKAADMIFPDDCTCDRKIKPFRFGLFISFCKIKLHLPKCTIQDTRKHFPAFRFRLLRIQNGRQHRLKNCNLVLKCLDRPLSTEVRVACAPTPITHDQCRAFIHAHGRSILAGDALPDVSGTGNRCSVTIPMFKSVHHNQTFLSSCSLLLSHPHIICPGLNARQLDIILFCDCT